MKCRLTIAAWFSTFLEKPLVRRVKQHIPIHIERLLRSKMEVETLRRSGWPVAYLIREMAMFAAMMTRTATKTIITTVR